MIHDLTCQENSAAEDVGLKFKQPCYGLLWIYYYYYYDKNWTDRVASSLLFLKYGHFALHYACAIMFILY